MAQVNWWEQDIELDGGRGEGWNETDELGQDNEWKMGVLEEAWLGDFVEFLLNGQFNHRQAEETVVEIIVSWLNKERTQTM